MSPIIPVIVLYLYFTTTDYRDCRSDSFLKCHHWALVLRDETGWVVTADDWNNGAHVVTRIYDCHRTII